jgi:hypothetical protein
VDDCAENANHRHVEEDQLSSEYRYFQISIQADSIRSQEGLAISQSPESFSEQRYERSESSSVHQNRSSFSTIRVMLALVGRDS